MNSLLQAAVPHCAQTTTPAAPISMMMHQLLNELRAPGDQTPVTPTAALRWFHSLKIVGGKGKAEGKVLLSRDGKEWKEKEGKGKPD